MQLEIALGINFTHSFVSLLARPTIQEAIYPLIRNCFICDLVVLGKSGCFL